MQASVTATEAARASSSQIHIATYIEVAAASASGGLKALIAYSDATRRGDGNISVDIVQETSRPNRFVVLEAWRDQAAFDAHGTSTATSSMREKLRPIANAPADQRVHNALSAGSGASTGREFVIVVSHVDVVPSKKDEAVAMLGPLAEANRKAAGNQRYDVLQQASRPNHFTVVESWSSQQAYDEIRAADVSRRFRDTLSTMSGALYDERLFHLID